MSSKNKILVVDDSQLNRFVISEIFRYDYTIIEAENGKEALDIIKKYNQDMVAVFLDVLMPVMNGIEVMEEMNKLGFVKTIPVFFITADDSKDMMKKGYDLGVVDIIRKPITPYFVKRRINNIIELYSARERLMEVVKIQEKEIVNKCEEIANLNYSIIETLSTAIEFRDCESGEHVHRIHDITAFILNKINGKIKNANFSEETIEEIATASIMHDVGKIAIPDAILNKPGKLTKEEYDLMKQHTIKGCKLLERIPQYRTHSLYMYAYDICRHHHERWDGKGYPDGLRGNQISIWAQVVSLADVYDALTAERVYKKAFDHEKAIDMIIKGECGVFNPEIIELMKSFEKEMKEKFIKKKQNPSICN